jgi:abortive infection bacteriophage resistance protein
MEPLKRDLKAQQPAFTISEQIENLKALGLKISDEEFAASFLNDVSYFRFVKAYSLGLKPTNGCYRQGVSFEQLVELYRFNSNFRNLLFPAKLYWWRCTMLCTCRNFKFRNAF